METMPSHRWISVRTIPKVGMFTFLVFYIISIVFFKQALAQLSPMDTLSVWDGYLCDLIDLHIVGTHTNPARPFGIMALWSVCFGMLFLWRNLILALQPHPNYPHLIWYGLGQVAVFLLLCLPFGAHDDLIFFSGIIGAVSIPFLCLTLKYNGHHKPYIAGTAFFGALLLNDGLYLLDIFVNALPSIQKGVLFLFILWYVLLDKISAGK